MNDRIFGRCIVCGMWTSRLSSQKHLLAKMHCWKCESLDQFIWHEIKSFSVWYKPWTWFKKKIIVSSHNNGWATQAIPQELWGLM